MHTRPCKRQKPRELLAKDAIAFAGSTFEAKAIPYADTTAAVADDFIGLESPCRSRESAPVHAQNIRKKFLGECEAVGSSTVLHRQQKASKARLYRVQSSTKNGLLDLDQETFDVGENHPLDQRVTIELPPKVGHRDAVGLSSDLDNAAGKGFTTTHSRDKAECALSTNRHRFHRMTRFSHDEKRQNARDWKVDEIDRRARLPQHMFGPEMKGLHVRHQPFTRIRGDPTKDEIGHLGGHLSRPIIGPDEGRNGAQQVGFRPRLMTSPGLASSLQAMTPMSSCSWSTTEPMRVGGNQDDG